MKIKLLITLILAVLLVGTGVYVVSTEYASAPVDVATSTPTGTTSPIITPAPIPEPIKAPIACTQEAKLCPDGSAVGRTGPHCEFAECPASTSTGEKIVRSVGETEGVFLIQKINIDSVDGLWHDLYPIERPNDPGRAVTLHIGDEAGYTCEGISDKLTSIDFAGQSVIFTKIVGIRPIGGCPICLSGSTLIDTPDGQVKVKELRVGHSVWTMDLAGHLVISTILKTGSVPVPKSHQMVHLILNDGREVSASVGHPTIDGRTVGDLVADNPYGNSIVVSVDRVPYDEGVTYDILPSGETGFYIANGILLGSTLR